MPMNDRIDRRTMLETPRLRFAVVGTNHGHIYGMVDVVVRGGGQLVSFHASEPDLAAEFAGRYPAAKQVTDERAILEDPSIQLVLSSITPNERAPLGVRVMEHGKDYMVDKPGVTSLAQLAEVRRVQSETKRIYSIVYSERFENAATVKAAELVKAGAIGQVIQTVGLGPHRHAARRLQRARDLTLHLSSRPSHAVAQSRDPYDSLKCGMGPGSRSARPG